MPVLAPARLQESVALLLQAEGTPDDIAAAVAASLVDADAVGHASHGVARLPSYIDDIRARRLDPAARPEVRREHGAVIALDAQNGWGHYAAGQAMSLAIDKAREYGVANVTITRCTHIGRLGEFVERAASCGCIGLATLGYGGRDLGWSSPYGGKEKMLMTNPIAIGAPTAGNRPYLLDFATTVSSRGKVEIARQRGEQVPEGWICDSAGRPTTNPRDFFDGGFLTIFGEYKGYGLSLAACLLGGLGGAFNAELNRMGGIFFQAVNVDAFLDVDTYKRNVDRFLNEIRGSRALNDGASVQVPGDMEAANRERAYHEGLDVSSESWAALEELLGGHAIALPLVAEA
jgi:uncharacterized oxidoreductase